jgi:hypothetical protein
MRFEGLRRKAMALAILAALAAGAWFTMGDGRPTWLVMILLAGFALRILLTPGIRDSHGTGDSQDAAGSRYDSESGK